MVAPSRPQAPSQRKLIEQGLGLLQVKRIEALGKPVVDGREKFARMRELPLIAPQPSHSRCRAQFEAPRPLRARDLERAAEREFGGTDVGRVSLQQSKPRTRYDSASHQR
jgi:hypothetical protein